LGETLFTEHFCAKDNLLDLLAPAAPASRKTFAGDTELAGI
jgi:hypothetical protein